MVSEMWPWLEVVSLQLHGGGVGGGLMVLTSIYIWKPLGGDGAASWSLDTVPATGVLTTFWEGGKRMGFTKVGETEVACCYSRSGLGGTVIQGQCLSPEGPLLGQGMVSLKSQLFPSLSLGTLIYLRRNRFC